MGGFPLKLLLDTHVLLWWLRDEPGLSREQVRRLARAEAGAEPHGVSAISLWEIATLAETGRIRFTRTVEDFLAALEQHPRIRVLPLTARIVLESTRLGASLHRDPADQIITATARVHGLSLVTADRRIRNSRVVTVV